MWLKLIATSNLLHTTIQDDFYVLFDWKLLVEWGVIEQEEYGMYVKQRDAISALVLLHNEYTYIKPKD